jgi:hypothetical protein
MNFVTDYLSKREDRYQAIREISAAVGFILAWPVFVLLGQFLMATL